MEAIDKTGEPVIAECLAALLCCADGAHGRPVCLDGPFSLAKVGCVSSVYCFGMYCMPLTKVTLRCCFVQVINREIMYATLQKLSTAGGAFAVSTPPYFKV